MGGSAGLIYGVYKVRGGERQRSGEVLAAVTADPRPVQGCRTIPLGVLGDAACASPDFATRFFEDGMTHEALRAAPCLRFDRWDGLQVRWAKDTFGFEFDAPTYTVASTHAVLDLAPAGVAWGMLPGIGSRRAIAPPTPRRGANASPF